MGGWNSSRYKRGISIRCKKCNKSFLFRQNLHIAYFHSLTKRFHYSFKVVCSRVSWRGFHLFSVPIFCKFCHFARIKWLVVTFLSQRVAKQVVVSKYRNYKFSVCRFNYFWHWVTRGQILNHKYMMAAG